MSGVYKIVSEWDIGEEEYVYGSKKTALECLKDNPNIPELLLDNECSLEDLFDQGLLSIKRLELIE